MCEIFLDPLSYLNDKLDSLTTKFWFYSPPFLKISFAIYCIETESVLQLNCSSIKIPTNSMVVKLTYRIPFVSLVLSEFPVMLTSIAAFFLVLFLKEIYFWLLPNWCFLLSSFQFGDNLSNRILCFSRHTI